MYSSTQGIHLFRKDIYPNFFYTKIMKSKKTHKSIKKDIPNSSTHKILKQQEKDAEDNSLLNNIYVIKGLLFLG